MSPFYWEGVRRGEWTSRNKTIVLYYGLLVGLAVGLLISKH